MACSTSHSVSPTFIQPSTNHLQPWIAHRDNERTGVFWLSAFLRVLLNTNLFILFTKQMMHFLTCQGVRMFGCKISTFCWDLNTSFPQYFHISHSLYEVQWSLTRNQLSFQQQPQRTEEKTWCGCISVSYYNCLYLSKLKTDHRPVISVSSSQWFLIYKSLIDMDQPGQGHQSVSQYPASVSGHSHIIKS